MPYGIYLHKPLSETHKKNIAKSLMGRSVSKETKEKISSALKNEKHFNWKDKPTYGIVHYWLRQNFGLASNCENKKCSKKSNRFDWALIHDKEYARNRDNFIQLCRSCHINYDRKYKNIGY